MAFCLVKELAQKMKEKIVSGELNIDKLMDMTSAERKAYFQEFMNERSAFEVNALFESKLLLKYQKRGLVNWAKQVTGMKPEAKNTLVDKIMKMEKILSPENEASFLQSLASRRLGTDVTLAEANKITELSENIRNLENYKTDKERIAYGRAKIELTNYVNSLNPKKANLITNIANVPRSLMASLDLSAPLNQGWGMLSRKQFYTSLKDMFKYVKSEGNLMDLQADILTRPNYKIYKKSGLRLTELGEKLEMREEQFMSNLLDKVPGIASSQRAYTGFLNKLRVDVFDDLLKKAKDNGEDVGIGSKVNEDLAKVVNNFTGGAKVGKIEGAVPALNAAFFSPRKITSTLNILDPRNYLNPKISKTARIAAIRNLVGSTLITFSILKLADMLGGENIEIEEDPRSSAFGKIQVGDTKLDISGGNATYATFLSRILTQSTKSSNTDVVTELGNKYGQSSGFDVLAQFIRNKLSPNFSFVVDTLAGANSIGEEKTIEQSLIDRMKPMFLNDFIELIKSDTKYKIPLVIGALFGGGLNSYSISEDWSTKDTKEIQEFKARVGEKNFKEANEEYNKLISGQINELKKNKEYQALSSDGKLSEIKKIKDKAKKKIFNEYNP